jgi:thiol-disulfide isomerase/thioredoxin
MTDRGLDEPSMGKASRTKVESTRREKIAAQRAAQRRSEQRKRILIASGSVVVVLAIVLAFVIISLNKKPAAAAAATPSASASPQGKTNGPTGAALAAVVTKVTSVPASTLNAVGTGSGLVTSKPSTISGTTLTENGKPEMLFFGAEYCPYCAAERWAMIVALSRFGTFKGLATVHSALSNGAGDAEPDPDTPSFTFLHATYSSKYLTFTPVELETNIPDPSNGEYTSLQTPTAAEQALSTKYAGPDGSIPWIDFGNHYMIEGVSYDPAVLDGNSWLTNATDLSNPSSPVAQSVDGTANYITAAICKGMTNNQPASACTPAVQALESQI